MLAAGTNVLNKQELLCFSCGVFLLALGFWNTRRLQGLLSHVLIPVDPKKTLPEDLFLFSNLEPVSVG